VLAGQPRHLIEVEALIARISEEQGVTRRSFTTDEILSRLLDPMVNEGARILEEGIALRSVDIDVIYLTGYGFPAYRGGPMFYADTLGLANVLAKVQAFGWEPAPLLVKLAAEGKTFSA
jgi:3-hydroxyacyl-CoA dehydrogenase